MIWVGNDSPVKSNSEKRMKHQPTLAFVVLLAGLFACESQQPKVDEDPLPTPKPASACKDSTSLDEEAECMKGEVAKNCDEDALYSCMYTAAKTRDMKASEACVERWCTRNAAASTLKPTPPEL